MYSTYIVALLKLRKFIVFYYCDRIISVSDSIYNIKKVTATKEENDWI